MQTNTTPYQKIALASRTTGLSQYFLRKGCKENRVSAKPALYGKSECYRS